MSGSHTSDLHSNSVDSHSGDYEIGTMNIKEQSKTYKGFIEWSVYGGILIAVLILGLLLVYGGHNPWFTVLVFMVGLAAGLIFLASRKL